MPNNPLKTESYSIDIILQKAGWGESNVQSLGADMGLRKYYLITKKTKAEADEGLNSNQALLMDMSMAGIHETGLKEFINVGDFLAHCGVVTPKIYYQDLDKGIALIEYFGEKSFGDVLDRDDNSPSQSGKKISKKEIYKRATNILIQIKNNEIENKIDLPPFDQSIIKKRIRMFIDFYAPTITDIKVNDALAEEYADVFYAIEASLPPCPVGFCHADYHLENIMWCPHKEEGYGLIDYQDAFHGFQGYDLLNILEDARQTVPADIKKDMRAQYCQGMGAEELKNFDHWYALMSIHFHSRVIGLFIKFSKEGRGDQFLQHIPRLEGYIAENLKNPIMAPLKEWLESHNIKFNIEPNI